MGAGLAKAFKSAYPLMFKSYVAACRSGELQVGVMHVYPIGGLLPRYVINFPTKQHWRNPSKLEYVERGLIALREVITDLELSSVAVPALGCGLGGLEWTVVRPMILSALSSVPTVILYPPRS